MGKTVQFIIYDFCAGTEAKLVMVDSGGCKWNGIDTDSNRR